MVSEHTLHFDTFCHAVILVEVVDVMYMDTFQRSTLLKDALCFLSSSVDLLLDTYA